MQINQTFGENYKYKENFKKENNANKSNLGGDGSLWLLAKLSTLTCVLIMIMTRGAVQKKGIIWEYFPIVGPSPKATTDTDEADDYGDSHVSLETWLSS